MTEKKGEYTAKDGHPCAMIEERNYINLRVDRIALRDSLYKKLIYVGWLQEQEIPRLKAENTRLVKELQEPNETIEQYGLANKIPCSVPIRHIKRILKLRK